MKILIVSGYFEPINTPRSFRTTELAKELSKQGHQVKVIVFSRLLNGVNYAEFKNKYNIEVQVVSLKYDALQQKSLIARAFNRFMSLFMAFPDIEISCKLPKVLKGEYGYDLLVSIAVPHQIHWGVSWYIKSHKGLCRTWVADCGDPYMGCKTDSFKPLFYFKYIEKRWCRLCDYIAIPVESAKSGYYSEFHDKIRIIPQGFNFEEIKLNSHYSKNEVPTFIYAGTLIPHIRDPKLFLEYLASLSLDFKFIIYTNNSSLVDSFKETLGNRLIIKEYIPRMELIKEMSKADFLINIENGTTSVQSPSKLIDYALADRPILSINSYVLDKKKVDEFLSGIYDNQLNVPDLSKYNIKNIVSQFLDLVR